MTSCIRITVEKLEASLLSICNNGFHRLSFSRLTEICLGALLKKNSIVNLLVVGGVNVVLLIHNFGISLWLAFTLNEDNVPT